MEYQLSIVPKPGYLHAVVTGRNTAENVASYLEEVLNVCRARNCRSLLVEERLEGPRLSMADVFRIASEGSAKAAGVVRSLAYVDVNAQDDTMKFAELVATNRSMPVCVFSTVADAERWLVTNFEENKPSDDNL